ncbi:MAG: DNA starvation/stationary phase protection protein [Alphaproteobacteria bacterium]|nr:DNA starvation/stationary phase protection protein [Alphaproteobacteria bacterium]
MTAAARGAIQTYGEVSPVRIGLGENVRVRSVAMLNHALAQTMALRDLYKKHHWQTSGEQFYELHLLFDKHYNEQVDATDALAERVQALGGVAIAAAHDVIEVSRIPRPPRDRESAAAQLERLLEAHDILLTEVRPLAREAADLGDDGTNDLIVSQIIRLNEAQAWFLSEHLRKSSAKA